MILENTAKPFAPNLFILGSAKCGTTSLYELLKAHPDVYMPELKEPGYFCDDFRKISSFQSYLNLFKTEEAFPIRGEASHSYLTTPSSAGKIHEHYPTAKFILILRNPAERAHSLYWHMRKGRFENIRTFEEALEIENDRYYSLVFRNECPHYFYNFMYFRSGLYGSQIERYFSLFGREQFHIITTNQLSDSFAETMKGICDFLNIDNTHTFTPIHTNQAKRFISRRIQKLYYHNKYLHFFLGKTNLIRLNQLRVPKLSERTKKQLMSRYAEDQELLNRLCGVKFT